MFERGVTSINDDAFNAYTSENDIKTLVLPNTLTSVQDRTFADYNIENLTLGTGIKTIGAFAFMNSDPETLTLPNSLTSIGEQAFGNAKKIRQLIIPNSVTYIGVKAFIGAANLTELVIPNNVTEIAQNAFEYSPLTSLTLGSSLKTIGEGAFYYAKLTTLTIPDSVTTIYADVFVTSVLNSLTFLGNPTSGPYLWTGSFMKTPIDNVQGANWLQWAKDKEARAFTD